MTTQALFASHWSCLAQPDLGRLPGESSGRKETLRDDNRPEAEQCSTPRQIGVLPQELAGHQDLSTTQRYMHLSPAAIDSAIRPLEQPRPRILCGDSVEAPEQEGAKTLL